MYLTLVYMVNFRHVGSVHGNVIDIIFNPAKINPIALGPDL